MILLLASAGFKPNVVDLIFQLIMFIILLAIPVAAVILMLIVSKKRNDRLKRVEEKLDHLISEKGKK